MIRADFDRPRETVLIAENGTRVLILGDPADLYVCSDEAAGQKWHPRGIAKWPDWRGVEIGQRVRHARTGATGVVYRVLLNVGVLRVRWDRFGTVGSVEAPAFDLEPITTIVHGSTAPRVPLSAETLAELDRVHVAGSASHIHLGDLR